MMKDPTYRIRTVSFPVALLFISRPSALKPEQISGSEVLKPIEELPFMGTNGAAQSSLIAIQVLEMCADQLPYDVPAREERGGQSTRD